MASAMYRLGFSCLSKSNALLNKRLFHVASVRFAAHDAEFKQAKERLGSLKNDPGNQKKLEIYGLFKQATVGACNVPKPGMMDFVGKAKWEAWNGLGSISQDDAQKAYIALVDSLVAAEGGSKDTDAAPAAASSNEDLKVENRDNMCVITLNRPDKKNAITRTMYIDIISALKAADNDPNVRVTVITGTGDFFSSGNDLGNLTEIDQSNMAVEAQKGGDLIIEFVDSFINFNKPMIGLVNGPVVGIACTILGLMDAVYASDKATFVTPFTSLGQSPEACSSYIFPKIMGAKAGELLMFNKKLNAGEALDRNLITAVIPSTSFQTEAWALVEGYAKLPKDSLRLTKALIRHAEREHLLKVNREEVKVLAERWQSQECFEAVMAFFSK